MAGCQACLRPERTIRRGLGDVRISRTLPFVGYCHIALRMMASCSVSVRAFPCYLSSVLKESVKYRLSYRMRPARAPDRALVNRAPTMGGSRPLGFDPSRTQGIPTPPREAGALVRSLLALATPTLGEGQRVQAHPFFVKGRSAAPPACWKWWARQDSNLQPDRYERSALTS